jgi:prepilin-type N-terminal cleavage/methylation domain-containing protein/prepilin-type processing-associated H-X9-DG protein
MLAGRFTRSRQTGHCGVPGARGGFSLMELLIVMFIIVVLSTLYYGGNSRTYQKKQIAVCEKNLETIYVALQTWANDYSNDFPTLANSRTSEPPLSQLIPRYTTGTEFFTCPGCKDSKLPDAQPFANRKISYAYYMGHTTKDGANQPLLSDRQVNTNSKTAGQPLFSADGKKPGNNHNKFGGNIMFCDGSVQSSPPPAAFNLTNAPGVILLNPRP